MLIRPSRTATPTSRPSFGSAVEKPPCWPAARIDESTALPTKSCAPRPSAETTSSAPTSSSSRRPACQTKRIDWPRSTGRSRQPPPDAAAGACAGIDRTECLVDLLLRPLEAFGVERLDGVGGPRDDRLGV